MKFIKFFIYFFICFQAVIGLVALNPIPSIFRMTIFLIMKIIFGAFLIFCLFFLIYRITKTKVVREKQIFFVFVILLLLDVFYTLLGILNGFGMRTINDFFTFIGGPLILVAVIQAQLNKEQIENLGRNVAHILFYSYAVVIAAMYVESFMGIPLYLSMSSSPLMFSFFYFLLNKATFKTILTVVIIIFSGKRGVMLGVIATYLIIFLLNKNFSFRSAITLALATAIPVFFTLFFLINIIFEGNTSNSPIANRIQKINPLAENHDYQKGSGERVEEITESLRAMDRYPLSFLIGSGNGFIYELKVNTKNFFEKERHNVHFSPVGYYTKFGILFVIFWYSFLFWSFNVQSELFKKSFIFSAFPSYQLGSFFMSFTVFSINGDIVFWFCMALSFVTLRIYRFKNASQI